MTAAKISIGDRVKVFKDGSFGGFYFVGAEGVVKQISDKDYLVKFDSGKYSKLADSSWYVAHHKVKKIVNKNIKKVKKK